MARRGLLNDAERRELFEVPRHEAGLIRHYTLSANDIEVAIGRYGADPESDQPLATLRFWPVMAGLDRPALLLGPLAVLPERRGQGLGRALVGHGLTLARDRGWRLCLVSGDPAYYRPYGFEPASPYGFALPGPITAGHLQVKALAAGALDSLPRGGTLRVLPWRGHRGSDGDGDAAVSQRRLRVG